LVEAPAEQVAQAAAPEPTEAREDAAGTAKALGISVRQPPTEVSQRLDTDHVGPLVTSVDVDSPAQGRVFAPQTGSADLVTHVNGTRTSTVEEFQLALSGVRPGDVVSLRLYNTAGGGQTRVVRIRVPK
jgi:S1-C subfamily serine protease